MTLFAERKLAQWGRQNLKAELVLPIRAARRRLEQGKSCQQERQHQDNLCKNLLLKNISPVWVSWHGDHREDAEGGQSESWRGTLVSEGTTPRVAKPRRWIVVLVAFSVLV